MEAEPKQLSPHRVGICSVSGRATKDGLDEQQKPFDENRGIWSAVESCSRD